MYENTMIYNEHPLKIVWQYYDNELVLVVKILTYLQERFKKVLFYFYMSNLHSEECFYMYYGIQCAHTFVLIFI